MFPKKEIILAKGQRGFLLPMALFIIVIMGIFSVTLWRTTAQTSMASVQEINTVQAFYTAETGGQYGMRLLFFIEPGNRQVIDDNCATLNVSLALLAQGLRNCRMRITCSCAYENAAVCDAGNAGNYSLTGPVVKSFYTITSIGSCGTGNYAAERTLALGSFMEQQ